MNQTLQNIISLYFSASLFYIEEILGPTSPLQITN